MMDVLEKRITALEVQVAALTLALKAKPAASVPTSGTVAGDGELDSQYGDPVVRKDPPRWKGTSYVGTAYSACPADYLLSLAGFLDWCSNKEAATPGKEKYAAYSAKDAARARGWAKRHPGNAVGASPEPAQKAEDPAWMFDE